MSSTYLIINAWREILARVFTDLPAQDNVTPEWLVNPATRRRLKLDRLYPDLGIAIRFEGLQARGQGRQSDWEVMENEQRDDTREELCRQHGVELVRIDIHEEDVPKALDALVRAISRAGRTLQQKPLKPAESARKMEVVAAARSRAGELRGLIARNPEQMLSNLSDAWRDRELGLAAPSIEPRATAQPATSARNLKTPALAEGQRVHHERYGDGVITHLVADGGDVKVSILFDAGEERTFLQSLLGGKIAVSPTR